MVMNSQKDDSGSVVTSSKDFSKHQEQLYNQLTALRTIKPESQKHRNNHTEVMNEILAQLINQPCFVISVMEIVMEIVL